uniref:DH domain-containing protein n=1 Tax=Schistosoma mansoni TaxID=6183 RepID=A0A5K4FBZ8_SCHMA
MPSSIKLLLDYSAHLYEARKYFEALREQKPAFIDFLSRCSHTHFSKRLDLWHFLECPKSRLTRYPLLLNRLIELTPSTDPELSHLLVVRSAFTFIIDELNRRVGEAMRNLYLECIGFHGNLELQYKDMVCHQKSLLLKGSLHTDIGEVTVFVFPQIMLITTFSGPDNNNSRLISRCYYGKLSRQIIKPHVITSSKNSPTSLVSPQPSIISSVSTRVYGHRWSLLSILRTRPPPDLGNATQTSFNSGNRPSKCARLFRRLSSIMTSSPSTKLDISRPVATASFTPADETVSLERFRICYPPLILKDYILEDIADDSIPSTILKFPFSTEKAHQNLFKLSPYEHNVKRKSGRTSVKQSNLLHSYEKIISRKSREIRWFSSSSLTSNRTSSLLRKSPKTISREFLFQASSLQDKKFWITTLTPLVHSYYQSESCNDLILD